MTDEEIQDRIEELVAEEHDLLRRAGAWACRSTSIAASNGCGSSSAASGTCCASVAREEFGLDPNLVQPRNPTGVENYTQ
jgi:hypothetical protein